MLTFCSLLMFAEKWIFNRLPNYFATFDPTSPILHPKPTILSMKSSVSPDIDQQMAQDVLQGLTQTPRRLPSRYFYDDRGSQLFQDIMRMDTYYPMNCEYDIFRQQTDQVLDFFSSPEKQFRLVEFGAGDGYKTKVLLKRMLERGFNFTYLPIDISEGAIDTLADSINEDLPRVDFQAVVGDYFDALHQINAAQHPNEHKVVLFLGSNIGNFTRAAALEFLQALAKEMKPQDRALIGFDLKKDPKVILPAYSDPWGITRAFNLNLLTRFNRELGANFDIDTWDHYASYDPISGETKSYLLSKATQRVHIESLERSFSFSAWEPIWTELSQKYDYTMIRDLAKSAGFKVVENLTDERHYYVNSVWEKVQ